MRLLTSAHAIPNQCYVHIAAHHTIEWQRLMYFHTYTHTHTYTHSANIALDFSFSSYIQSLCCFLFSSSEILCSIHSMVVAFLFIITIFFFNSTFISKSYACIQKIYVIPFVSDAPGNIQQLLSDNARMQTTIAVYVCECVWRHFECHCKMRMRQSILIISSLYGWCLTWLLRTLSWYIFRFGFNCFRFIIFVSVWLLLKSVRLDDEICWCS